MPFDFSSEQRDAIFESGGLPLQIHDRETNKVYTLREEGVEPFPNYISIVQFSLRLLGIYLAAVGISYVTQYIAELMLTEDPRYKYLPNPPS